MTPKIFLSLLSLILTSFLHSQIPNYVPTNGLQGFWPFTGNANDLSVNANNGVVNGATLTQDRFNNPNSAYSFNGFSNYISTNYTGILGNNPRAVSVWAKTTESVNGMYVVGWGANGHGDRFGCGINAYSNGPVIGGGNCYLTYSPTSPISNDTWHHYVFQYSGVGPNFSSVEIYHNGTLLTQTLSTYQPNQLVNTINTFNVHFGKIDYNAGPAHFLGQIDEVGIWNRTLTPCEINELYHSVKTTVNFNTSDTSVCRGQTLNIIASGINSYTWNTGSNSSSISVSPSITTVYTVSGTSTLTGCFASKSISVSVLDCTGLNTNSKNDNGIWIYPNPNNGHFTIETYDDSDVVIINSLGEHVYSFSLNKENNHHINISHLSEGIYFIAAKNDTFNWYKKIIINK